jgi:oligopeptide transport system substrate-binding protein
VSGPKFRWIAAIAMVAVAAFVALGCGSDSGGDGGSGELAKDQTLRINIAADPESFDPSVASFVDTYNTQNAIWAGLYRLTGKESELTPWLAEELPEVSEDGLKYTVKLRDAKWSDGSPITADDVAFGIRRSLDPAVGAYYATLLLDIVGACEYNTSGPAAKDEGPKDDEEQCDGFKTDRKPESIGVKAIDDKTVEFTLEKQVPWFEQILALTVTYPQPQEVVEKFGEKWTEPQNIVTSGAFTLADYKRKESITLKKNPEFWDADNVTLDTIEMVMIEDPATAAKEFEKGDIDTGYVRTMFPNGQLDRWKTTDEYFSVPTSSTQYMYINTTNEELRDPKVRQGLALALNRKSVVENVTRRGDIVSEAMIPTVLPGYDTIKEGNQDFLTPEGDLDKAKELLEQGGWKEGTELSAYYASDSTSAQDVVEAFQSDLEKVGVKLKPVPVVSDVLQEPGYGVSPVDEKVDLLFQGWAADYLDAQNYYQLFTCANVEGGLNAANYCDEEYDEVYNQALETVDDGDRYELYKQLEAMLTGPDGGMPAIPTYEPVDQTLIQDWVEGFEPLPSSLLFFEDVKIHEH